MSPHQTNKGGSPQSNAVACVDALITIPPTDLRFRHTAWALVLTITLGCYSSVSQSAAQTIKVNSRAAQAGDGVVEARLIDIYRLIGIGNTRDALIKAERLVTSYPTFQLAQLVYGDLLASQSRPIQGLGDVPREIAQHGVQNLLALRAESKLRMAAVTQYPPADTFPSQFVSLSSRNKHAIAVDTAKARLYLFENSRAGTRLLASYYISVGKEGVGKQTEGDQRTPLGIYFITSNLDPDSLKDLYGSGALPINYPNVLDLRRGKTGGGIWLHGTPSNQFTRAPQATDGCVAVANPDLERILRTVEIRTTPVLIGTSFNWVRSSNLIAQRQFFTERLQMWAKTKRIGLESELLRFYANDFKSDGKDLGQFSVNLASELKRLRGKPVQLKDVSLIRWTDDADTLVATFGEIAEGERVGRTVRQYWQQRGNDWKIIYEGEV